MHRAIWRLTINPNLSVEQKEANMAEVKQAEQCIIRASEDGIQYLYRYLRFPL